MNTHIRIVLQWGLLITMASGIVPPKVPGLSLPAKVLENIRIDPGYYMPGRALTGLIQARRLAKMAADGAAQLPDTMLAVLPVLCMQYADVEAEEWPIPLMQEQLFGEWGSGSMRDYYLETSYGALEVTGDVIGWIPMAGDSEYYERDPNGFSGPNTYELLTDALAAVDSAVDFAKYDLDNDGTVDFMVFIHSGTGGEYGGSGIWSHSWALSALGGQVFTTNDTTPNGTSVVVNGYVIQPAVDPQGTMEAIGVFCHELGHALGLPDLYDRDSSSEGIGHLGLMAVCGAES
ncbi:MAG: M6 family metalloprotease domain-containing protein, partial [Candidatus Marinimicrobia bacterium]|nr:M6 family metalloprotease domain-containing protein [Candidatus Neomarinimicrobiota bacterium]